MKNENVMVSEGHSAALGKVLATVPDLIVVMERDTGRPLYVDELAYGQRVAVVVLPCDVQYRSGAAAAAVSPSSFNVVDVAEPVLLERVPDMDALDESLVPF